MKHGRTRGFMCNSQSSTAVLRSAVASRRPIRTIVDRGGVDIKYSRLVEARRQSAAAAAAAAAAMREKRLQLVPLHTAAAPPERRLQLVPTSTAEAAERRLEVVPWPTGSPSDVRLQLIPWPAVPPERRMPIVERRSLSKVTAGAETAHLQQKPPERDFQVVEMRVSIHCQGCAGKVRKLLYKMEGVTSVSIDLEEKRVTVEGRVSPAAVLERVSRVKRAEFWSGLDLPGV